MHKTDSVIFFPSFTQFPQLVVGISTRSLGTMKEKGVVFPHNLQNFLDILQTHLNTVVFTRQMHGNTIIEVFDTKKQIIGDADGLITTQKNIYLGMATADCLPIIFYEPSKKIIGVVHAGYKGILAGIIENMITAMKKAGGEINNIFVGIGPSIGICCYDVTSGRVAEFEKKIDSKSVSVTKDKKFFLDLKRVATEILLQQGIQQKNIEVLAICTNCEVDRFFSYRGSDKRPFGEFATVIGMV